MNGGCFCTGKRGLFLIIIEVMLEGVISALLHHVKSANLKTEVNYVFQNNRQ
ncbi:hypothetical protein SD78_3393 [Bacillus badius]|nr:hypothetical protein SD78_3393 [Bacillus badius]